MIPLLAGALAGAFMAVASTACFSGYVHKIRHARGSAAPVEMAADNGHWSVLKWLRTQDPPCPWSAETEAKAKEHFGEAEVASWAM